MLIILSLILVGCGGSSSNTNTAISEANSSLEDLKDGVSDGDETVIASAISDDGVIIVNNVTNETLEYSQNTFITALTNDPQSILILSLINETTQVNGDTVTISGESLASFQLPSSGVQTTSNSSDNNLMITGNLTGSIVREILLNTSNNSITTQDAYSGTYFSVEYPDNWYSFSDSDTNIEASIAFPNSQKSASAFWYKNVFDGAALDYFMTKLENAFFSMKTFTDYPYLDNLTFNYSNNDNYVSAEKYTATYDYNYKPIMVEIELQKEGDSYKITKITVGQSSTIKIVSVTEKGNVINKNDDLYFISYGGNNEVYNESEANSIFDSFDI
jgi:hypothetical protein